MHKRLLLLTGVFLLTSCGGTKKPEESSKAVETTVVTTEETADTSEIPLDTSTPKVTWEGTEFDNPANQAKFETLYNRVVSNLEYNGITLMADDFEESDLGAVALKSWAEGIRKEYSSKSKDTFTLDLDNATQEDVLSVLRYAFLGQSDSWTSPELIIRSYGMSLDPHNVRSSYKGHNIKHYADLLDSMAGGQKLEDDAKVVPNLFNTLQYSHSVKDKPDIADWFISPGTKASDISGSFNNTAEEWGIEEKELSKIFMGVGYLPSTSGGMETFEAGYEDYTVLNKVLTFLHYNLKEDETPKAYKFFNDNYSKIHSKMRSLANSRYPALKDDTNADTIKNADTLVLDKKGIPELYKDFVKYLKSECDTITWRELLTVLDLDTLTYDDLKSLLANSLIANTMDYGVVFSSGVNSTIVSGSIVGGTDWHLTMPLMSGIITETQLRETVTNYIIMVGALTGETYTRSMDIAISGMVNKTTAGDYVFTIDYFHGVAILGIAKG